MTGNHEQDPPAAELVACKQQPQNKPLLSLGIRLIPSWLQVKSLPLFCFLFSDLLCHVTPPPLPHPAK